MHAELTPMQNIVNSLAVLSFLGMVIALFALSALLRMVRDLQQAALATGAPAPSAVAAARTVPRFASPDERPTFVLVVTEHCQSCRERAARLAAVSDGRVGGHLKLLSAADACAEWTAGTDIESIVNADLLGAVAVGVTPSLVKYAPDGAEIWRRAVGSDDDLDRHLEVRSSANVR
ncbi:hypothetical protein [Nonomuraea turcica]|uniref:hypothetical protein n=1 Tax=Nonomuraea sp. G32 TaxID=3067274 RepID=UPI00273B8876|nr:hypothetical protein [Nonomuraea sp. G32]MDP4504814.1 hypothetical protein [Nonomuraea sp. G32]